MLAALMSLAGRSRDSGFYERPEELTLEEGVEVDPAGIISHLRPDCGAATHASLGGDLDSRYTLFEGQRKKQRRGGEVHGRSPSLKFPGLKRMEEISFRKLRPATGFVKRGELPLERVIVGLLSRLGLVDPTLARAQLTRELIAAQVSGGEYPFSEMSWN